MKATVSEIYKAAKEIIIDVDVVSISTTLQVLVKMGFLKRYIQASDGKIYKDLSDVPLSYRLDDLSPIYETKDDCI